MLAVGVLTLALVGALAWWVLVRTEPRPWGTVDVEGDVVRVHYVGGECDRGERLEVEETATEVVLTVRLRAWEMSCSDVGVPRTLSATLDSPVGEREVVDGACREPEHATSMACSDD